MNRLTATLERWLFDRGNRADPLWQRAVRRACQYLYALTRDLTSGQLTLRAMSLVYTTLLSVVPLLAMSFSLFKGFGVHNNLKDELFNLMAPLGEKGAEITEWVIRTVDNVEGSVLGTVSLAFFIYTAIAMVQKVESSFNFVWQVEHSRNLARRVTEYISVLLVGPLVMAIALTLIASISSNSLVVRLSEIEPFGSAMVMVGKTLPYLLVTGVFTFLFKFLPNATVRFRAALAGGLASGFLWATAGAVFASFVAVSTTRNAIYSTFAVAISALIWLYVSWLILLIGAQISFYVQHPVFLKIGRDTPRLSGEFRERVALNVMLLVGRAFREGDAPVTVNTLAELTNIQPISLASVVGDLVSEGVLSYTESDTLLPGREMSRLKLRDIRAAIRQRGDQDAASAPVWTPAAESLFDELEASSATVLTETSLTDWLDTTYGDAVSSTAD